MVFPLIAVVQLDVAAVVVVFSQLLSKVSWDVMAYYSVVRTEILTIFLCLFFGLIA